LAILSPSSVPLHELLPCQSWAFHGRHHCQLRRDAEVKDLPVRSEMPDMMTMEGLSLADITGNCTNDMTLANISGAKLRDIRVTGYPGSLLTATNVSGSGLTASPELKQ